MTSFVFSNQNSLKASKTVFVFFFFYIFNTLFPTSFD